MSLIKVSTEEEWHNLRGKVVTATEVSCILGLNKYKSAAKMWQEKNGKGEAFVGNSYTYIGQLLEPVVVKAVNYHLDREFELFEVEGEKSFYTHDKLKMGATPDAWDGKELLECKTTKPHNAVRWSGFPNLQYLCQLYIQMMCMDISTGYLGTMSTDLTQKHTSLTFPLSVYILNRDEAIDKLISEEVIRFWDTVNRDKAFRVNRKLSQKLKWLFLFNVTRVH